MTPKEKAKELFNRYYEMAYSIEWTDNETKVKAEKFNDELGTDVLKYWNELSRQNALIAVQELIDQCHSYREIDLGMSLDYWEEVKQEINKL